jgi:hypothetical protein
LELMRTEYKWRQRLTNVQCLSGRIFCVVATSICQVNGKEKMSG